VFASSLVSGFTRFPGKHLRALADGPGGHLLAKMERRTVSEESGMRVLKKSLRSQRRPKPKNQTTRSKRFWVAGHAAMRDGS